MLYLFGFQKIGVVISDLYFVDPHPIPGQESPERGARLEVRFLEQHAVEGSIYASRPIAIGLPIWRADLLESADGPPGTFDRTHHHPGYRGWEAGERVFDEELSARPMAWVGRALGDLKSLLAWAGLDPGDVGEDDARQLADAVPEILDALSRLLARVHAGELATAPAGGELAAARISWL